MERTGKITCYCCLCKVHNMCQYALLVAGEFEMSIFFWNEERLTFNYHLAVAVNSKRPKGKDGRKYMLLVFVQDVSACLDLFLTNLKC
jgi:hypothetical protein